MEYWVNELAEKSHHLFPSLGLLEASISKDMFSAIRDKHRLLSGVLEITYNGKQRVAFTNGIQEKYLSFAREKLTRLIHTTL